MDINPPPEPQNSENIGHERNWFVPKPAQASIAYLLLVAFMYSKLYLMILCILILISKYTKNMLS